MLMTFNYIIQVMEGIFAVNKPKGMTSHDVVAIVRKRTGVKRVGHGGTLDPMAEGVLVIAVGRENTKLLDQFVKGEKEYVAEVFLGASSDTYDAEGVIENVNNNIKPELSTIQDLSKEFTGNIMQTPPVFSSVKIKGKPAHRRVRKGEKIELKPRPVVVKSINILDYSYPILKLKVVTGPGVYIRSIANDLGEKLGTGGYLTGLIRTKVGKFELKDAFEIEEFRSNT